jgi:succinate dehydrogenase / fumarate reductase cytochrome b subunit
MPTPDPNRERLKRVHSLTGMLPVAAFLLAHFAVNAAAVRGPGAFDALAAKLDGIPYLVALEWLAIALPFAVHIAIGVWLVATDAVEPPPRRLAERLQRISGIFLAFFVIYHVWATRLSTEIAAGDPERFALMARHLAHPGVAIVYGLAVIAAAFHLGHGFVAFAQRWGLSRPGSRLVVRAGWVVFALVAAVGLNALLAFRSREARWLEPPDSERVVTSRRTSIRW